MCSFRNRINTPRRLLVRSGPESSTSFKETPLNCADESKTILTWLGFLGWYTLKIGRYQNSSFSVTNGARSARPESKIFCINVVVCWHLTGFFFKLMSRMRARLTACCLLSGSLLLGSLKGKGAIHLPLSPRQNSRSSIHYQLSEKQSLQYFKFRISDTHGKYSSLCFLECKFSFTTMLFGHGSHKVVLSFGRTVTYAFCLDI